MRKIQVSVYDTLLIEFEQVSVYDILVTTLVNLLAVVCNLYLSLLSTTAESVVCSTSYMVLFSVEVRVIPIEGMLRQVVRPKRCISKKAAVCIEEPFTPPCCFSISKYTHMHDLLPPLSEVFRKVC